MILFDPSLMENVWHLASPYLAAALPHGAGEYSLDDLERGCRAGEYQLWKATAGSAHAWVVTSICQFPSTKLLYILALGGNGLNVKMYAEGWETLGIFAKANGCSGIEAFARRGWGQSGTFPAAAQHKADVIYVKV